MSEPVYRSTSQRRKFRECGFKHVLHYQQGWRTKKDKGVFRFGHIMQDVANEITQGHLASAADAEALFLNLWAPVEAMDLVWPKTRPWSVYRDRGRELAKLMFAELPNRIRNIQFMDTEIRYEISPGVYELAIPDLYAEVLGDDGVWRWTILDYKTSDRDYNPLAAEIDEQLTDYELAVKSQGKPVEQLGLCVLIMGAKPRIQWLLAPARSQDVLDRFILTAVAIDRMIKDGIFVQNDRSCFYMAGCDFIPLCYGSQRGRIEEELQRVRPGEEVEYGWDDTEV